MKLELEYTCTDAENKEAQNLQLQQQLGRGSKWRTRLVLSGLLVIAAATVYKRLTTDMSANDLLVFAAIVVVVFAGMIILKRVAAQERGKVVRLEVSDREVAFGTVGGGRTAMLWSGFAHCLESPNLFVLVDRTKTLLYVVPKRTFPDESARNWFRALANQPRSIAPAAAAEESLHSGRSAVANGIALTLQIKFRDYLCRSFTSWRVRGLVIFLFLVVTATSLFTPSPPDAVNSPLKVYLWMLAIVTPMLPIVLMVASAISWRAEQKSRAPQHIIVTNQGIEFADPDSSGRTPWSSYKYFLENRWSFFIWNPRGSLWFMFPKREFASSSDLDQFRAILRANLTPSRWFYL